MGRPESASDRGRVAELREIAESLREIVKEYADIRRHSLDASVAGSASRAAVEVDRLAFLLERTRDEA